jgi:putative ATP-binding cassette transporter
MRLITFLIQHSRRTAVLAVLAGIISGVCNTGMIAVVNSALRSKDASAFNALLWVFVTLCLLLPLMRFASEYLLLKLGQGAMFELRMQLSRQVLETPLRRLEEIGVPRLLASLTDDIPIITAALLMIPVICINIAVVLGSLIYLGWLSWPLLLAVLVFLALGIASYQLPIIKAIKYLRVAREHTDALLTHFRALTDGTKELKLHRRRREAFLSEVLRSSAEHFREQTLKGMTLSTAAASWGQTLAFFVVGLVVFGLPSFYRIDVQTLSGYVIVLLYIMTPLQIVMNTVPNLSRANVAVMRVEELGLSLRKYAAEERTDARGELDATWDGLELIGVTHTYHREEENDSFMLGPVSFALHPGELVFLVGGNGSGKTTLAKILTGLYAPESGEISLGGLPVNDENRDQYRQLFSVVFSDFYLFESLLGIDTPDLDEQAREYLRRLHLNHKVQVTDGRLTTTKLSQGQRKRLALLTAYLEDRPVYVFDEWAADQDPLFKEIFYYQLLPELKRRGKAVLVISHDDRYYHVADRIIKLDYGKVVYDQQLESAEPAPSTLDVTLAGERAKGAHS